MADRVDELLERLGVTGGSLLAVSRPLIARAVELGASDDEIITAARTARLGPLLLDLAIRPPGETTTLDAFIERSGLDPALVRRAWSAFGLPLDPDSPVLVTPDAAQAVHVVSFLGVLLGEEPAFALARVIGSAMASVADTLTNSTRIGVEVPNLDAGVPYSDTTNDLVDAARDLLPELLNAVSAVFRRHLVLASYGAWQPDEDHTAVTTRKTVGFVDLVGSTEVLRSQSVAELAASVDAFERLVWDEVGRAGGRVVKLIGDEAMFVLDSPAAACAVARSLVASSPSDVRVGLAHGDVVALHGDYYGPTVNLAARLVSVADARSVLVSESVVGALPDAGATAVDVGALRGFPDITKAYAITPS